MQTTIITLHKQGHNKTHIAKEVGVDRKTVRKVIASYEAGEEAVAKKPHPSYWDAYKDVIELGLSKKLTIQRIYQDLLESAKITASYSGLRDYIGKAFPERKTAYMVLKAEPGEEAQVDYGLIGTIPVSGKRKKAWAFVMTLSYSRYMYAEISFDQSVKSFIQAHVNAFKYFGGIPRLLKIDYAAELTTLHAYGKATCVQGFARKVRNNLVERVKMFYDIRLLPQFFTIQVAIVRLPHRFADHLPRYESIETRCGVHACMTE